jgi:hypothetical protein
MTDEKDKRERQTATPVKNPKQDRLKLALRENLKRRKSQARGRSHAVAAPSGGVDAALDEDGEKKPVK